MTNESQPFYFGEHSTPLFGWLHRPDPSRARPLGLVICNPHGYEAICAHRSIRQLAAVAAMNGIATLRFDYAGTGDSSGDDLEPGRVDAWTKSIDNAVEFLKAQCGLQAIALAGIRLGATLAATVASRRGDIDSLILIAPVVNGRAYLRELRALQIAAGLDQSTASPDVAQEALGFNLSLETQQAICQLDLTKLPARPAARTLLWAKDDGFGVAAFAAHLNSLGSSLSRQDPVGYTEMMFDAHEAVTPMLMWRGSVDWLISQADPTPSAATSQTPVRTHALIPHAGSDLREEAVFIDADASAFGILTTAGTASSRKGVLLLNAGAVHRVGPNRMWVTLARRWAQAGMVVMRLDLSGLGDSAPREGADENIVYSRHANDDVARAVEFLRKRFGVDEVESIGLCSGGYHSLKAASAGVNLHRVTLINPLTFFWKDGMSTRYPQYRVIADAQRYKKNAFQFSSWLKMLKGQVDMRAVVRVGLATIAKLGWRAKRRMARLVRRPLSNDLGFELDQLAKRGVTLAFVFAIGEPGLEMLQSQGGSVVARLESRNRLHIDLIDNADHTFTIRASREQLIELLTQRVAPSASASTLS